MKESFSLLQTTSGMLFHIANRTSDFQQLLSCGPCCDCRYLSQEKDVQLPITGQRGLCCTLVETIPKQMWGADGEWCKTAAAQPSLVSLDVKQFKVTCPCFIKPDYKPCISRWYMRAREWWIWCCRVCFL